MFKELKTERLVLREIKESDANDLFASFSRDDVTKFYGQDSMREIEQARKLIEFFAESRRNKRGIRWGIQRKGQNGLIGSIGFNNIALSHKRAEIGYEIHPDFWRMGFASEAIEAVLSYGFFHMELNRIGAIVYIENDASNRLLQKLGFEKEGVLKEYMHQNNRFYDVTMYGLLKDQFEEIGKVQHERNAKLDYEHFKLLQDR
ncbi:ribosomal-protein-alanine N-acetyltransferase [Bacillus sp. OV322]|uniref:GNAT family N-acetyltransferase n=1 Tax=Bacillus sp. OV322 TaxID=1882764 RepID=UPI0008E4370C|nr:GNAT family protein [Bacillus sp. OV322]SFB94417.1 ribosomal-protein-alanine N-acetyltransferase [Bacillus sp. OV322]